MAQSNRPFGITLLMALGVIGGFFSAVTGIFMILDRNDNDLQQQGFHTANQLVALGGFMILIGLVQLMLALALGGGSNGVRILFAIIAVLNLAGGVWALVALHSEQRAAGAGAAAYAVIVLYLLFNHRAEEFFESANR
jgi:hypothetical protein